MSNKPATFQDSLTTIWQSILELWQSFLSHLPFLISGILILGLTWLFAKAVKSTLRRTLNPQSFKRSFRDLLQELASVGVWILGFMLAIITVFPGMTPAKVLAGLGLGSIALGFAFKDIVENFLAGVLILWRFPFEPGDFIRWNDNEGKVEDVTIRMTLIRQTDGELIVLPNAKLFKEPVFVLTTLPIRRTTVICGVAYSEDIDKSRSVIQKAVEACESVDHSKPVEIFAQEFADSSINFEVTWWSGSTPLEVRQSRDEIVAAVKRSLDEANIEIPFPYRTLTFKEPLHTISKTPDNKHF